MQINTALHNCREKSIHGMVVKNKDVHIEVSGLYV